MVEVRSKIPPQPAENPRKKIREARLARLKVIDGPPRTVKVYAGSEALRGVLRHPGNQGMGGIRFRETLGEAVEWPNDAFTKRRIADGSVRTDGPARDLPGLVLDETLNARQHAVALAGARAVADKAKATVQLTSLSPNTAVSGSADVVMSCIGVGFTPDTVIKFGDYDEPTTFVSPTEVTTGVKPSLFAPAAVPVLVRNGDVSSEPLDFTFTAAEGAVQKPESNGNRKSSEPKSPPPHSAA